MLRAMRLAPNTPLCKPGDVVEVDDSLFEEFRGQGVFDDPEKNSTEVTPEPEPAPEPPPKPSAADKPPEGERPKQAASTDTWREYAKKVGVDPKGLSKQEIIAATK